MRTLRKVASDGSGARPARSEEARRINYATGFIMVRMSWGAGRRVREVGD